MDPSPRGGLPAKSGELQVNPKTLLHYEIHPTTSPDPAPWLMVLAPPIIDLGFMQDVIYDADLLARCNIVAFEHHTSGRSRVEPHAACDPWTIAVDYARALDMLEIPPVHIFGSGGWPAESVTRLALLFPKKVLSMALCGLPPSVEDEFLQRAFSECVRAWTDPEDVDDYFEIVHAIKGWLLGSPDDTKLELLDRFASVVMRRYSPCHSTTTFAFAAPYLARSAVPPKYTEAQKHPLMVFKGTRDQCWSVETVQERLAGFKQAESAELVMIEGAPCFSIMSHYEPIKRHYIPFLEDRLRSAAPSHFRPAKGDFGAALNFLAEIAGDPTIKDRDPTSNFSFTTFTPEVIAENQAMLDALGELQKSKFSLTNTNSREAWENAPFEEEVPFRFTRRFDAARLGTHVVDIGRLTLGEAVSEIGEEVEAT